MGLIVTSRSSPMAPSVQSEGAMQTKGDFVFVVFATAISIIFTVVVSEVMLQIAAFMFPRVDAILFPSEYIDVLPDAELGHKGNPNFPQRDANGFRNKTVPDTTD